MHVASVTSSFRGSRLPVAQRRPCQRLAPKQCSAVAQLEGLAEAAGEPRLRLNNIGPQPGSRRRHKRKGRGHAAGQGGSCGFGTAGQKSRAGSGTRVGFQGGQTPLYRQLPKLKGIAGGMSAGIAKHVTVNLADLNERFSEGETVSLATLQEKKLLNLSGRLAKLPLKVLGEGRLEHKLTVNAAQFSASAREKIEAAGGTVEVAVQRRKWTKTLGKQRKSGRAPPHKKSSTKAARKAARAAYPNAI